MLTFHEKICATNKTDAFYISDDSSMDLIDLYNYGLQNIKGYRNILVVIEFFFKFGMTLPMEKKNAQTKEDSFGNILNSPKKDEYG